MIYKFLFSTNGDNFYPDNVLSFIKGEFILADKNNTGDKKFENREDIYEFGSATFWHPNKFSTEENISKYEQWFIEFIENNYRLFRDNGAEDFDIYMEIYYEGEQCNFEIFDKKMLKKLSQFDISIPISVYSLKTNEYLKWKKEIKLQWDNQE